MSKAKETMLGVVAIVVIIAGILFSTYIEQHYTMTATVTSYNTVVDETGNKWIDDRASNYSLNDVVTVTFNTNNTDNTREDDVVEGIKK